MNEALLFVSAGNYCFYNLTNNNTWIRLFQTQHYKWTMAISLPGVFTDCGFFYFEIFVAGFDRLRTILWTLFIMM
jgi:hypothetical protein